MQTGIPEPTQRLGFNSEEVSFLWRVLHQLLPTLGRVSRIIPNTSPMCKLCDDVVVEDLSHALFSCPFNSIPSQALMNSLSSVQPNLVPSMVLTLSFEVNESMELP